MGKTQYDKDWNIKGYVSDDGKTLYDKNWNVSGHVSDDGKTIYDKNWNVVGHVSDDGKTIYDKNWNILEHISDDGKTTYDKDWNVSGHTTESGECFLTTACIEYAGLPDDCIELQTMRQFRDQYIRTLPDADILLSDYYRLAPLIVARIKSKTDSDSIFQQLLAKLRKAVTLIQSGRRPEALAFCKRELAALRKKYVC